jgi:ADP-ribose pyrophosphatase YjhB (NUDIX family)
LEIAAEICAGHTDLPANSFLENFLIQGGYATPKIDVRGAVIRDGKILLVQEKADNKWSMPGGWADVGALPSAMVAREVREESGFIVKVERLAAVYDANHFEPLEFFHAYKMIFLCTIVDGKAAPSIETLAVDFFSPDDLPPLSKSRTNKTMLSEVLAHFNDPHRPVYVD